MEWEAFRRYEEQNAFRRRAPKAGARKRCPEGRFLPDDTCEQDLPLVYVDGGYYDPDEVYDADVFSSIPKVNFFDPYSEIIFPSDLVGDTPGKKKGSARSAHRNRR